MINALRGHFFLLFWTFINEWNENKTLRLLCINALFRLQHSSEPLDVDKLILEELNNKTSGDSFIKCGNQKQCYLDRDVILRMQSEAPNVAIKYTVVILALYVIGLGLLWLHFVKQKYGQVREFSILDIGRFFLTKNSSF